MRTTCVLLVACLALAFQVSCAEGQFSFSLPGKWGNGKRAGAGHQLDCKKADPEMLFQVYKAATAEMTRVSECLQRKLKFDVVNANEN